jgi:hypothetical protein
MVQGPGRSRLLLLGGRTGNGRPGGLRQRVIEASRTALPPAPCITGLRSYAVFSYIDGA